MDTSRDGADEMVFCHQCENRWLKTGEGITCPRCHSDFTEVLDSNDNLEDDTAPFEFLPRSPRSPRSPQLDPFNPHVHYPHNPFDHHNPWDGNPNVTHYQIGPGTFTFTSTTVRPRQNPYNTYRDPAMDDIHANFNTMLGNILGQRVTPPRTPGGGFMTQSPRALDPDFPFGNRGVNTTRRMYPRNEVPPGPDINGYAPVTDRSPEEAALIERSLFSLFFGYPGGVGNTPRAARTQDPNIPPDPFALFRSLFNPANASAGDAVFTQEALDRVISQLMEQHSGSNAPGPASQAAINSLPTKKVDKAMLGTDGKAECSICMDAVELDSEVTELPCHHWFHGDCVSAWLREHDTCPHCRQGITAASQQTPNQNPNQQPGTPPGMSPRPQDYPRGSASRQRSFTTIDGSRIRSRGSDNSIPGAYPRNSIYTPEINDPLEPTSSSRPGPDGRHGSSSSSSGRRHGSDREGDRERDRERRRSRRDSQDQGSRGGGGAIGWVRSHFGGGGS